MLLLALAMIVLPLEAATAQLGDAQIKADFIPKFARYVQWPAGLHPTPREPFMLCVIGRDPFGPLLDQAAAGELIDGHAVTVRRMDGPEGAAGCHLAFVQGQTPEDTGRFLRELDQQPVLTVTDAQAGPQRGMIHFT